MIGDELVLHDVRGVYAALQFCHVPPGQSAVSYTMPADTTSSRPHKPHSPLSQPNRHHSLTQDHL
jgi:hypothetical protein